MNKYQWEEVSVTNDYLHGLTVIRIICEQKLIAVKRMPNLITKQRGQRGGGNKKIKPAPALIIAERAGFSEAG